MKKVTKKPKKQSKEFYDYFEIKSYIVNKYDCKADEDVTWDYMCNNSEIRNDSFGYIPTHLGNKFTDAVKEEFGEELEVWISW